MRVASASHAPTVRQIFAGATVVGAATINIEILEVGAIAVRTVGRSIAASGDEESEPRPLGLYDSGVSFQYTLLPGEDKSVDLQSAGIGLRYEAGSNIQLQLDYGWQMTNVPGINNDDRIHVNAVFSF